MQISLRTNNTNQNPNFKGAKEIENLNNASKTCADIIRRDFDKFEPAYAKEMYKDFQILDQATNDFIKQEDNKLEKDFAGRVEAFLNNACSFIENKDFPTQWVETIDNFKFYIKNSAKKLNKFISNAPDAFYTSSKNITTNNEPNVLDSYLKSQAESSQLASTSTENIPELKDDIAEETKQKLTKLSENISLNKSCKPITEAVNELRTETDILIQPLLSPDIKTFRMPKSKYSLDEKIQSEKLKEIAQDLTFFSKYAAEEDYQELANTFEALGDAHLANGKSKLARKAYLKAYNIKDSLYEPQLSSNPTVEQSNQKWMFKQDSKRLLTKLKDLCLDAYRDPQASNTEKNANSVILGKLNKKQRMANVKLMSIEDIEKMINGN